MLLAVLAAALWITGRSGLQSSLAESAAKYRVAHWLQQLARHADGFRLAGGSRLPMARMDAEVDDYLAHRQAHFRVLARQSMAVVVVKTLVTGGLLVIGAALVVNRRITLGQFVASELVIVTVLAGVEKLILSLSTVYDALTAVEKVAHLREVPVVAARAPGDAALALPARPRGVAVEARGLTYHYPGQAEPALRDLSLDVAPDARVALVGAEGAGTSTLLRALAGLLPSYRGALALDGVSARDLDERALREAVGFVGPAPEPFEGTIEENVAVGRAGVTAADVAVALYTAGLRDFVRALPDGLRTRVAGGTLPSHALRKLALARAIVGRPRLLLLDEFFHHLDADYKRGLLSRILDRRAGWTVIAASHDPAYLAACDRVLLVEAGRVVADGTYDLLRGELSARGLLRAHPAAPAGASIVMGPRA